MHRWDGLLSGQENVYNVATPTVFAGSGNIYRLPAINFYKETGAMHCHTHQGSCSTHHPMQLHVTVLRTPKPTSAKLNTTLTGFHFQFRNY